MSKWRHERSSRLIRNLSNCEREAWKKFRLQRDSNPWPLRYRCSALPTELWSHNCWEQVNFSGSIMPLRVIQHYSDWVCTAVMSKWRHERSSRLIRNLSNCEREAWKKFRLQRDSNPWPLRYRCSALPTELWSHNCWEQVNFSGSIMPLRVIQHYSDWVCTAVMSKWRHERSSRLIRNLSNCEREARFLVFLSMFSSSSSLQLIIPAPYRRTDTAHVFMASMVFLPFYLDFRTFFILQKYSLLNAFFVLSCSRSSYSRIPRYLYPSCFTVFIFWPYRYHCWSPGH